LANTLFHHRLSITSAPPAKIETAYHQADDAIQHLIDVVAAWTRSERQIHRMSPLETRD